MAETPSSVDLLRIRVSDGGIFSLEANWVAVALLAAAIFGLWFYSARKNGTLSRKNYEIDEASFGIGNQTVKFKPNLGDRTVAYKIWVELSTRKIGLKIDPEHDVIVEVYDSWYNFFQVTRELIKEVPVSKARGDSTQKIINLSIDVLNEGLRPHLTKWQSRFRRWYNFRVDHEDHRDFHPQQIQQDYPEYDDLIRDLLALNDKLCAYRQKLREIVFE